LRVSLVWAETVGGGRWGRMSESKSTRRQTTANQAADDCARVRGNDKRDDRCCSVCVLAMKAFVLAFVL